MEKFKNSKSQVKVLNKSAIGKVANTLNYLNLFRYATLNTKLTQSFFLKMLFRKFKEQYDGFLGALLS